MSYTSHTHRYTTSVYRKFSLFLFWYVVGDVANFNCIIYCVMVDSVVVVAVIVVANVVVAASVRSNGSIGIMCVVYVSDVGGAGVVVFCCVYWCCCWMWCWLCC